MRRRIAPLVVAAIFMGPVIAPRDAAAYTMAEVTIAIQIFEFITAMTLKFVATAKAEADRGSAEIDTEAQGRDAGDLISRIEGRLALARQNLKSAEENIQKLHRTHREYLAKAMKSPEANSEAGKRSLLQFREAYMKAKDKVEGPYREAKRALLRAEGRFRTFKQRARRSGVGTGSKKN